MKATPTADRYPLSALHLPLLHLSLPLFSSPHPASRFLRFSPLASLIPQNGARGAAADACVRHACGDLQTESTLRSAMGNELRRPAFADDMGGES